MIKSTVSEFLDEVERKRIQDEFVTEDENKFMPLYNVLTESLNIELVYVVLKSITRFAYLHTN